MSSTAVIACGALAVHVRDVARRRGFDVDVFPVPAPLHNRPELIAPAVDELASSLRSRYSRLVLAYADCGTYGALDSLGLERLRGDHCYDVFAREEVAEAMAEEPGTYFLTDFLARTFEHTVIRELGLDRYPELRDDYFGGYTRVLWLAQRRTRATERAARRAAERLGLPLEVREVGDVGIERELERVLHNSADEFPPRRRSLQRNVRQQPDRSIAPERTGSEGPPDATSRGARARGARGTRRERDVHVGPG
jgi:uncharacterized protein DUF1638